MSDCHRFNQELKWSEETIPPEENTSLPFRVFTFHKIFPIKKMFAIILGCPLLLSFIAKQFFTRTPCGLFKLTGHPTGSSQNAEPLF